MSNIAEDLGNLTYSQIDQLEINLSNPEVQNLHYYNEYIIRLLTQTLRNNRFLADNIQKVVTEGRLSYGACNEALNKMEKVSKKIKHIENNVDFLIGSKTYNYNDNRDKGVPIGRTD